MRNRILISGFGSLVVDVLMTGETILPEHKNLVTQQSIQVGGVIPTALIVLSRLGIATQFHSTIGNDLFGTALAEILRRESVDTRYLIQKPKKQTPFAFVIIQPSNGKRTSFYTTGTFSSESGKEFHHIDPASSFLLVDAHNPQATKGHMEAARKIDIPVLLDLGNPKPGIDDLIPLADGVIAPQAYWKKVWTHTDPDKIAISLRSRGPKLVVLTMEEDGCFVATESEIFHQPSYNITAIDTNGAGDVFFGSFVFGLTQQWDIKKTAMFACAAAARSCTIIGKEKKIPQSTDEVFDFIDHTSVA